MANGNVSVTPSREEVDHPPFLVVIGASAGGVSALQTFFDVLPQDTGAAFIVIVHLDPTRPSELAAILAQRTRMPVRQVDGPTEVEPNTVYIIPPNEQLGIQQQRITPQPFDEPRGHRSPIDFFMRSVASELGFGFGVILSGAGSDGAQGARAFKEAGGIILAQEPSEAEYASMPNSAIATGAVDFVLPVTKLANQLGELISSSKEAATKSQAAVDETLLRKILTHLRLKTSHDFSSYKRSTVLRRIARRMQITRNDELGSYYEYLRENADEAQLLFGDLLISVTSFFRDREAFDALRQRVLPQLMEGKSGEERLRIWIAGCATGEEAYSVAMLVLEEIGRRDQRPSVQIFASDLDVRALATARDGLYPASIEADVDEERLRRFFVKEGEGFRVRQELRDIVLFTNHDMLKDPPFSRLDLICCRNVMIYLDRELQEQVINTFHYALNPGGFLMLGSSETADHPPGLFRTVDRGARLYQSTAQPTDKPRLLPRLLSAVALRDFGPPPQHNPHLSALSDATRHRRALEATAPPSILVDRGQRAIHLSDNAGRFLQPSGGPLTGDVVDLVRPELRFELRAALHRVFEQNLPTLSLPIPVRFNGHPHRVVVHVKSAGETSEDKPALALVMFIEGDEVELAAGDADQQATNEAVKRLTQELELAQLRLMTMREESDAATEELRATNEELQSINEEYRSTSEELETSREELQSINEELQTVNSELKLKLDAISRAHSDLQNLMAATDFGTLFLDAQLRIKRFTEPVRQLFSVTPNDEGRPITDFAHRLDYPDLIKDARSVLSELAPIRREVKSDANNWFDVRLRPYRTVDDRIDGVVITFMDVTERHRTEQALLDSASELSHQKRLVDLSRDPIIVWDFDRGIADWNRGSEELYGYTKSEVLGRMPDQLLATTVPNSSFDTVRQILAQEGTWAGELVQVSRNGTAITVESRLHLELVEGRRMVLESDRDVGDRKRWEEQQKLLLHELTHRVKNILAVAQSMARMTLQSSTSPAQFVEAFEGRLAAMGRSHSLLVESDWRGADLEALARTQLEPYLGDGTDQVRIAGAPIMLNPVLTAPLGLVIHELATNAAKYGALSQPGGQIEVKWSVVRDQTGSKLLINWVERTPRTIEAVGPPGFGSKLIEVSVPGATVEKNFEPHGLTCTFSVPLDSAESPMNAG
jgi:two-component system, chemotaxis family, CheB/CheR fusion protein